MRIGGRKQNDCLPCRVPSAGVKHFQYAWGKHCLRCVYGIYATDVNSCMNLAMADCLGKLPSAWCTSETIQPASLAVGIVLVFEPIVRASVDLRAPISPRIPTPDGPRASQNAENYRRHRITRGLESRRGQSQVSMEQRKKREIPEKTRRPAVSCGTIYTCKNLRRGDPLGIEPGTPWHSPCEIVSTPTTVDDHFTKKIFSSSGNENSPFKLNKRRSQPKTDSKKLTGEGTQQQNDRGEGGNRGAPKKPHTAPATSAMFPSCESPERALLEAGWGMEVLRNAIAEEQEYREKTRRPIAGNVAMRAVSEQSTLVSFLQPANRGLCGRLCKHEPLTIYSSGKFLRIVPRLVLTRYTAPSLLAEHSTPPSARTNQRRENIKPLQHSTCAFMISSQLLEARQTRVIKDVIITPTNLFVNIAIICFSTIHGCVFREKCLLLNASLTEISMEQRRNARAAGKRDPLENPPTTGIVRHVSHMRKYGEASSLTTTPPCVSQPDSGCGEPSRPRSAAIERAQGLRASVAEWTSFSGRRLARREARGERSDQRVRNLRLRTSEQ
ncbi:hypothetical protein PR048_030330 [Dryococelus australis]|uniref:Uncharacterized protein n=1 Tax=Dryococelus australis TaxID=614101 RepID=A0ABQ9G8P1_9NEOP|nr:hypothetical protein PR048_030330 [Dryococelus australis]